MNGRKRYGTEGTGLEQNEKVLNKRKKSETEGRGLKQEEEV